jgi:hypothetical protein
LTISPRTLSRCVRAIHFHLRRQPLPIQFRLCCLALPIHFRLRRNSLTFRVCNRRLARLVCLQFLPRCPLGFELRLKLGSLRVRLRRLSSLSLLHSFRSVRFRLGLALRRQPPLGSNPFLFLASQ